MPKICLKLGTDSVDQLQYTLTGNCATSLSFLKIGQVSQCASIPDSVASLRQYMPSLVDLVLLRYAILTRRGIRT